jgi:NADPH2:quinone reductase
VTAEGRRNEGDNMRGWQLDELGDPWEVMNLNELESPIPGEGEARITVEAADLNFADILQMQGTYQVRIDPPFVPGMAAAGVVVETGPGSTLSVGDRVVGSTVPGHGGFAEEAIVTAETALRVPDGLDLGIAAAANVTYGTSWFALHRRGNIQPGESVLVLAAAGGVGSSAVQMAKAHGCFVIAAAGGAEKVQVCRDLGADISIDYNADDVYAEVMAATDGRGVDVVYDPVGGEYFDIARRLVAWEGRLLVVGFASGTIPSAPANHVLVKNYSVVGVHMGGYRGRDNSLVDQCYEEVFAMLADAKLAPHVSETVGMADLPDALLRLSQRKTTGRVMFDPRR